MEIVVENLKNYRRNQQALKLFTVKKFKNIMKKLVLK